jgi:[protein-PII] uridylyltransferase
VQDLLKKIEAAAEARLAFSPDATPAEKLARYKHFLKVESHRLKLMHRAGADGREICQARAAILDALLRHLWATAKKNLSAQAQKEFPPIALVALGGFGRAELNPHSDIDFMFLHDGQVVGTKPLPYLAKLIDGILYPLWDIGLKIGYSVRDLADCVKVANADMQSKTSLIESRLIAGNENLFAKFQKTVVQKCVLGFEGKYIAARLEDQATRRAKFGNSACMQEPNVKNGCGGLRDFQNLLWMSFFKYRTRSLRDLQTQEFVSEAERKQLEAAYEFLLRVRTELHYNTNRPQDVLGKNLQPAVATNLGYTDRSPSRRIEKFMRDLYVHMRNVYLITRTLEQRMALLSPLQTGRITRLRRMLPGAAPRKMPEPVDGFLFVNGEIRAVNNRVFRDSPRRLMRVFLHAQQRHLTLHPDLAQLIRNQLSLVDREFLNDEHVRETFLTILDRRGEVAQILRAMHEVNFLGKYLPEFGKLTCLVQHEFYHQYSADEHTLVCLEQLDKIWEAQEPPYKFYEPVFQALEHPGLLYLACCCTMSARPHPTKKAGTLRPAPCSPCALPNAYSSTRRRRRRWSSWWKTICSWPRSRSAATWTTRQSSAMWRGRSARRKS